MQQTYYKTSICITIRAHNNHTTNLRTPLNMQTKLTLTNLLAFWIVFSHVLSNAIAFNPEGDPNHLFGELSSPIFNSRLAPRQDPVCVNSSFGARNSVHPPIYP